MPHEVSTLSFLDQSQHQYAYLLGLTSLPYWTSSQNLTQVMRPFLEILALTQACNGSLYISCPNHLHQVTFWPHAHFLDESEVQISEIAEQSSQMASGYIVGFFSAHPPAMMSLEHCIYHLWSILCVMYQNREIKESKVTHQRYRRSDSLKLWW